jgi:hypothetical protein
MNAVEENKELKQALAIDKPFSLHWPSNGLCKENMELKLRIMDLTEALTEITGSTDAAIAAEYLCAESAASTS